MLYRIILFFILLSFFYSSLSDAQDSLELKKSILVKKVFGFTPVNKSTEINGLAVGLWADGLRQNKLSINGLSIELDLFTIIGLPYVVVGSLVAPFNQDTTKKYTGALLSYNRFVDSISPGNTIISGVSIGILGSNEANYLKGVGINGFMCGIHKIDGLVLSGFVNINYELNGVSVAGFRNKATKAKGIQIALFNTCNSGKLIQIGLLNRIGRRVTPFINFSLKSNKSRGKHYP